MKVTHIFWSLTFGGIETMLVNIANAQAEVGAEVSVMIINDCWEETLIHAIDPRVRVLYVHKRLGSGSPFFMWRMNRMLLRERPDVIHIHGCNIWPLLLHRRLKQRVCLTLHDMPHGEISRGRWIGRLLPLVNIKTRSNVQQIDRIPRVYAISQAVHDDLLAMYDVHSLVVCNGIPTQTFRQRMPGGPNSPLRMVQVSRLVHDKKGQDLLIAATAQLKGRVTVDFIGTGDSMDYLQRLTHELGAGVWVHFSGKRTQAEVKQMLADYDLFVQPSRYEGFGLTVAEAMAAGVPVLVSSGQGPAEVTCDDRYGWTFVNGSADDLVRAITHIVDHYAEALAKADRARTYVVDTYDVSVTARTYLSVYQEQIDSIQMKKVNKTLTGGGKTSRLVLPLFDDDAPAERRCA